MNNLQSILGNLKTKGYKLTPVRKNLIEILLLSSRPLSIIDLMLKFKLKKMNPNKTTVYREVAFLKSFGAIQEVEFGDGKKRYESKQHHHHHIICIKCNLVKDIQMENDLDTEERRIFKEMGFKPINHSLEFFGLCSKCQ